MSLYVLNINIDDPLKFMDFIMCVVPEDESILLDFFTTRSSKYVSESEVYLKWDVSDRCRDTTHRMK